MNSRLSSRFTQQLLNPLQTTIRHNRLYYSIKSYSVDCTEASLNEMAQIFAVAIENKSCRKQFYVKTSKRFRKKIRADSSFPESNRDSVYQPLMLKCYTPTFRAKKSSPKSSPKRTKPRVFSLCGTKIQSKPRTKAYIETQDASTFT